MVNITTIDEPCSHVICQKSGQVLGNGPWQAMYLFIILEEGISIYKKSKIILLISELNALLGWSNIISAENQRTVLLHHFFKVELSKNQLRL